MPDLPGSGDLRRLANKSTWGFHERYANDPEFKRQIDEGRIRSRAKQSLESLKQSLLMPTRKAKLY